MEEKHAVNKFNRKCPPLTTDGRSEYEQLELIEEPNTKPMEKVVATGVPTIKDMSTVVSHALFHASFIGLPDHVVVAGWHIAKPLRQGKAR